MHLQNRPNLGLCVTILIILAFCCAPSVAQIPGANVNMVSGTDWPGGDPFLQRQNEPSLAVSSRNPFHILAGANDYRSVDLARTTNGETGDAWLGLFKSLDGGNTWRSILLPGCPYNTPVCGGAPAVKNAGFQAAADPVVRAGTNGMFYYAGLVFNRGLNPQSSIIVARLIDLNNKENADPKDILNGDAIQYIDTSIVASGTASIFLDKPTAAVDVPRVGAATCNLSVNQPGNGLVQQSFLAGNVYVAYTGFAEAPNTDPETVTTPPASKIYFVRSTNCGASWSPPKIISGAGTLNQGAVIAINPITGAVFVAWRQFNFQSGNTLQPDAIVGTISNDGGQTFSAPVQISTFSPFDEGTTNTSFRTNAFPTAAFDARSRVYVAYSARNTVPSGDARIVVTSSLGGTLWTKPMVVDNPPIDPLNNPSGRGHQIMPALTFAAGRLSLLYYDLRLDHTFGLFTPLVSQGQPTGLYGDTPTFAGELGLSPPLLGAVFNTFIDDSTTSLRRHTFDLRVAQGIPGAIPVFTPSVLVSQYAYGCCATNQADIEQLQFNAPNLPLFRSGTAPFMGDYVDLAPAPLIIPPQNTTAGVNDGNADDDDWAFNITPANPTTWHAAWTDNRDVQAPADGDWTHYTPPISPSLSATSIFDPATSPPVCQPGFTGSRNQNIYTAPISGGLVFGAPANTKQLGTTVFNGQVVPFQRAFALVAQNTTNVVKSYRLTIANQPPGGNASFLQFSQLTTLDLSIPPLSSATRPVFVTSTSPTARVTVTIAEITAPAGTLVPGGLSSSTTLNPDPTNPAITNPAITNTNPGNPAITNFEVTNPAITNPAITNPAITNPAITNPAITNPAITNATFQNVSVVNPAITNPAITNPAITNASVANPAITNPAITNVTPSESITDTQWTVSNTGNTEGAYTINLASSSNNTNGNFLQLIISKLYQTPQAPTGQSCKLSVETHNVVVTNIKGPVLLSPTDPAITNPAITNPAITNSTVALAPGETANIILRVVNPDTTQFPTFNAAANVQPVSVAQALDTQTALSVPPGGTPPPPPTTAPPLQITTTSLPSTVTGSLYSTSIQIAGGNLTSHTFSIISGVLPSNLNLDPNTGTISGTVTSAPAVFSFVVQAQDLAAGAFPQHTATQNLSITILGSGPVIATLSPAPVLAPSTPRASFTGNFVISGQNLQGATVTTDGPLVLTGPAVVNASGTSILQPYSIGCCVPQQGQIFHLFINTAGGAATLTDTVALTSQVPANVSFVSQPSNSVGGQVLAGSPVVVQVTDNSGAAIAGMDVTMSFNGTPPCSAATLAGTLSQVTNAAGQASFADLSIDRGQLGYTLLASTGSASAVSAPFTVNGFCATTSLSVPRELDTVAPLGNGTVLIAGGANAINNLFSFFSTAELYNPVTGAVSPTGNLTAPNGRGLHASVVLPNGKVLLLGGQDSAGNELATAELYDPSSRTFTPTGNMGQPRNRPGAVLLADGRVLVSGGHNSTSGTLNTSEIYDPATGAFSPTGNLNQARFRHMMTLLPNGMVLIAGGRSFGTPVPVFASAELFDPKANNGVGAFTFTSNMNSPRDEARATLLSSGKVLIAGGAVDYQTLAVTSSAETFDPATNTFTLTTGSMSAPRGHPTASLLPDGRVVVAGGVPDFGNTTPGLASADVFNPATDTFSSTGSMTIGREFAQAIILPNGNPLISGGDDGINTTATQEIYYSTAPLAPMQITTAALAPAATGQPFTQILLQQGGVGNLTWTVTGTLPSGLTFTNQGILIGTPTVAGSFPLSFTLTDSSTPAKTATANLTLTVTNSQLAFTSNTVPTAAVGRPYTQVLPVAGGKQPYNSTITAGSLPPGMVVAGNLLTGTPTGSGNFTFTVSVTDSSSPAQTASQTFTMSVNTLVITTTALPNGIVNVPYNAAINTAGGTLPLFFSLTTAAFPPGLLIQQPGPGSSSGALSGTPTQAGTFTFSESVADSSNPQQTATQNYTVTIAPAGSPVPANVTFVTEPQNSVGGKTLSGGPIMVRVADAANNPIPNTTVAMTLMGIFGTPLSCSVASLNGTLNAITDGNGLATFANLSIDRGGYNYALLASTGSASGSSGPFSVQGFCGSANLSTQREGHTQDVLGTAFTRKFPLDPAGTYLFTNTNPGPGGIPDNPHAPLIISLAQFNVKPGDIISGVPVGDENACGFAGEPCFGELFQPFTCAVFSSSNTLLPPGGAINRVPGAIAPDFSTAFPCFTGNTVFGNLPTDIPQDFALSGERVTVPPGAAFLFVGVNDVFFSDNVDPNGDLGVAFTLNSTTSVNSKVLIAGGVDNLGNALNTAELYDPALNFTQPTGNLTDPNGRVNHVSVVLPDGRVLLIGGASNISILASAELYDPSTGTFSATGSMSHARNLPAAVLLADGRVLVSGGADNNAVVDTAEIFDPKTGLFTPTGNMNQPRTRHTMTLLPNGKVLVTGGRDAAINFVALASAEIFDPSANGGVGAFTPIANMNSPRFKHTATLLSNGTVLVAGGFNGDINIPSVASAEIFDPKTNTFTPTGSMNTPRARHTATLLPDGTVLMAGGIDNFSGILAAAPAELYSPASGTFSPTGSMITGRELPAATLLLPNGNVLVSGGDNGIDVLPTTETYFNTVPQAPIVITTTSVPNGVISQPYVQLLLSQNKTAPIFWSLASGTLPPGINLIVTGVLIGTPTAAGSFTFTVQVTDGISTAIATYTINVSLSTLAFTSNAMPTAGAGKPYSQRLPVTGGKLPYNATVTSGTLPPGLTLSTNGVLSGTPTSAGSFTFTVSVTDSSTPTQTATQTLTIAVDTLSITTTALPSGIVGVPYNAAISTSGGTLPLAFSPADATFPPGLVIQQPAANSHSGTLAGTPTQAGHYTFTESVVDSSSPAQTASQYYTMDVFPAGSTAAPAHVTFLRQPQNSVGGQILAGSPIVVKVTDANNQPIFGASVAISFNGAPPCSTAVLSGTLTADTGGNGNVAFSDLSIDRGQLNYTLLASAGSASAVSQPFTVNGFCPTGNLSSARRYPTSTLLQNGRVLVTGGDPDPVTNGSTSSELFDPATGSFTTSGTMITARADHRASLLANGKVLVTGGRGVGNTGQTAELYDPTTGLFAATGSMANARSGHSSTRLGDGRVLVVGGFTGGAFSATQTAEIYDPISGTFTATGNLVTGRGGQTATLLTSGKVLITGGRDAVGPLASAEIYDPLAGTWTSVGSMTTARYLHAATLLPNGKVLVTGGQSTGLAALASAELFDPASNTFTATGNLFVVSVGSNATLLSDATVLISGGYDPSGTSSEIYTAAGGSFSLTGALVQARLGHGATLLANGQVLVSGGADPANNGTTTLLNSSEIYYSAGTGNAIFVSNRTGNAINVLDGATGSVITTIANVPTPQLMAFNPSDSALYVTTFTSNGPLYDINPQNDTVAATIAVGTEDHGVAVSADGSRIYVSNFGGTVSVINGFTNQVIATIPTGGQPAGIAITPQGQFVYVTDVSSKTVHVIDTSSNTVVKTISVGFFPVGIAVSPDGNSVYVTNYDSTVSVIATSSNTVVNTIPVGPGDWAVAFTPDGTKAYVTSETSNNVWVIDTASQTSTSIPVGTPTSGLAVYPGGRYVFAGSKTGVLIRIDTVTGAAITFASNLGEAVAVAIPVVSPLRMTIDTISLNPATLGSPYTQILLEEGGVGTLTWTQTGGTLPTGITLGTDGILRGTPTSTGTFTFTVRLTDSSTPAKVTSATFTLTVNGTAAPPLVFGPQSLPTAIVGSPYTPSLVASGGTPPISFAVTTGAPPAGISLGANGAFTGTPTAAGTSTFTVTVTDSSSPQQTASQSVTIQVASPLAMTTTSLPNGTANTAYSASITSSGGIPPVSFAVTSGTSPPGLTLASTGPQSASLSGTPTASGTFTFTITATDTSTPAQTSSQTYTITIAPPSAQPAHVAFTDQPLNAIAGQAIAGHSPIQVQVLDASNVAIPNFPVTMAFNGAPPCAAATLGGTFTQNTDATGTASFPDLTINRGQFNYTLAATAGTIVGTSAPFNVEGFCDTGSLTTQRVIHSVVALPNGKVLIAGGGPGATQPAVATAELFDPATGVSTSTGSMNVARMNFTMTLLQNGKVLITGGFDNRGAVFSSAELFDPATNQFTLLPNSMTTPRGLHHATLLADGRVLITGGESTVALLASAELFDPSNNTFTATNGSMTAARERHQADLLPNGKVLLTGGASGPSAELYDPVADSFTSTGNMSAARADHASALLFNGKVLVAGGTGDTTAELYDPAAGTFGPTGNTAQVESGLDGWNVPVLTDGSVFLAGGGPSPSSAESYDPSLGTFRSRGNLLHLQLQAQSVLLPNGTVLVTGGEDTTETAVANNEIFYPITFIPISITTVLPTAQLNTPYTQQLQQKGGLGTLTWIVSAGTLPAGLTLNTSGLLSGTPTAIGVSQFTVQVTDSSVPPQTTTTTYFLVVVPPLTIVPALPTANPGVAYSQPIIVGGGASPYTFTITAGALPAGLNLNTSTGVVSGTTNATGNFAFTVQVSDSSSPPVIVTQAVLITVAPPLAITTPTLPNGQLTVSYNSTVTTTGGFSPIFFALASGSLPTGLALSPQGAITGTPTAAGSFTFTIAAVDSSAQPQLAQQNYTVTVGAPPNSITLTPNPMNLVATTSATMTVTLGSPAPTNGLTVGLTSSNTAVASVPATIIVLQGATTATFQVTAGTSAGSPIITASATGFTNGTATVNVTLRTLTLTLPGPLLGVGRTFSATVTIDAPAPANGTVVSLGSSDTNIATVSPATFTIPAGATTATFTLTGVNTGTATLTASAPGFQSAVTTLTVTSSLISLQSGTLTVAPGQSSSLAVSLSSPAGPGGVTINFVSANTSVATVSASVFVPQGQQTAAANPQVTGVSIGSTFITASATGFGPDTSIVQVTVTASFSPTSLSVPATRTANITLNISAPAPQPNGITFNLSSDNTSGATVPQTAVIPAGQVSVSIPVTGVAQGTANISAASTGITTTSAIINVGPAPTLSINASTNVGKDLQVDNQSISLGAAAPANETLTLTSDSPNLLLANSPAGPFSQSITLQLSFASFSVPPFSMQALASTGTAHLAASATGYANGAVTVSLTPSGIEWFNSSFNTTTFSTDSNLTLIASQLNPNTLTVQSFQNVRTGLSLSVTVTSSNTATGTIVTSPVTFATDSNSTTVAFHPLAPGTSNVVITTPAGFSTPAGTNATSIVATVTAPNLTVNVATNLGQNLQVDNQSITLAAAPPTNRTLTLTSNSASLLIANTAAGPFSQSITLQLSQGSFSVPTFSVQGLANTGTAQLTASAAGYNDGTDTVTFTPSGIEWFSGNFNTTTFSADTSLTLISAQLNPATLAVQSFQNVRTGLNLNVTVTTSDITIGTIVTSPVIIVADTNSTIAKFHPVAAGTANVLITTPSGFSTPSGVGATSLTANVTAPNLTVNVSTNLGQNLQVDNQSISLGAAPPSNRTLTLNSNSPSLLISTSPSGPFSQSITFQLSQGSFSVGSFSMQALAGSGSAQLTASAPGYNDGTSTVNLTPSGIEWFNGNFNTTTFSGDTTLTLIAGQLNPSTLNLQSFQNIRTGFSLSVTVTSSDPTIGTIVTSPVVFAADTNSATTKFHPLTAGAANLVLTEPTGFTPPAGTNATSITANVTAPTLALNAPANLGQNLQVDNQSISLGAAPPNNETLTVSSSSANVLLANSPTGPFSQSISLALSKGSFSVPTFSVQGLAGTGSAQLTAQAPGYADGVSVVNLTPSGIEWFSGNVNTTTFSSDTTLTLIAGQLNPNNLNLQSFQNIRTGLSVSVTITSSDITIGTIVSSPVIIAADTNSTTTKFHPLAAGTTNLVITTPAGFTTVNGVGATSVTATVTAPNLSVSIPGNLGQNLQADNQSVSLGAAPPTNRILTLTSNSPNLLIASAPAGPFSQSITLQLTQGSFSVPTFSVQSLAGTGTGQLTASAAGYNDGVATTNLTPSGVVWNSGNFNTTTFSSDSTVSIISGQLNPSTLTFQSFQNIRTGLAVSVTITSSDTTIGRIVTSPITIAPDSNFASTTFHPLAAGTTNLIITTPAGFTTPNGTGSTSIVATVSAPAISVNAQANLGQNLQLDNQSIGLGAAPPSNETLTLTSSSASILLAAGPAGPFSQSITLQLTGGSFSVPSFSVQGLAASGAGQITASAPGYTNGTATINLTPSAIVWNTGSVNTTTFSSDSNVSLVSVQLNPATLTAQATQNLRTGLPLNVIVASSDTAVGTIVSPVAFAADTSFAATTFHPVASGTANLTITQPAGFTNPNGAGAASIVATVTAPVLTISPATTSLGQNLQLDNQSIGISAAPPTARNLTLSSNSAALLIAASPAGPFSQSITLQMTAGSPVVPTFSVQGLTAAGSGQLTASAPGYTSSNITINLTPSAIKWNVGDFSISLGSGDTSLGLVAIQLDPSTLTEQNLESIRSGLSVSVTISSSVPGVGTITSPVNFSPDTSFTSALFHPVASGSTVLSIATPSGFTTPNPPGATSVTATVQ